ncbi:MAG: S8 family peptidase [Bdellovibrionota bacterium]
MKFLGAIPLLLFAFSAHAADLRILAVPRAGATSLSKEFAAIRASKLVRSSRAVFGRSEAAALGKLGDKSLGRSLLLRFASEEKLHKFKRWARRNAPDFRIETDPVVRPTSDPLLPLQWGLKNNGGTYSVNIDDFTTRKLPATSGEDINVAGAPAAKKQIVVAVLDTGIDLTHPDLKNVIVRHEAECKVLEAYQACAAKPGAKCADPAVVDHDGNGYPLDCHGWNLAQPDDGRGAESIGALPQSDGVLGDAGVQDFAGHGTHVAGIIAAQLNGVGVEGVAPNALILPVRVISGEPNESIKAQDTGLPGTKEADLKVPYGLGDIVARGMLYAIRSNAQVINMSLGFPDPLDSDLLRRLIQIARSRGVLVVAAAGNDSTESVILPCRYDGVICVGAHSPDGSLAFFSNYGYGVDILAPGWNIISTYPMSMTPIAFTDQLGYESKDGTSMSAPFVSGMLARLLGAGLSPDEAYARLILGARPTRDSKIEEPSLFANSSLSGNADLGRAFQVSPQALILPSRKNPARIEWDRSSSHVPFAFQLADHWLAAQNVTISVEALNPAVRLAQSSWSVPAWNALDEKTFATSVSILDPRLDSELDFRVTVSGGNASARSFLVRAEIVSPVGPQTAGGTYSKILPIVDSSGNSATRAYDEVKTVVLNGHAGREYLGLTETGNARVAELLVEAPGSHGPVMVIQGKLTLSKNGAEINSLQKLSNPATGAANYALLEVLPPAPKQHVQAIQITWLDGALKPLAGRPAQSVDPTVTAMPEDFQWQLRNGELVATWYGVGLIPVSERKPFDPWHPKDNTAPGLRFYFLAHDGLHSLSLPTNYPNMVSLLPQSPAQLKAGVVSVLLSKGTDYINDYVLAEIANGAWKNIQPLSLTAYHNIVGIIPSPVLSLDPGQSFLGSAFSGYVATDVGPKGSRRSTVIKPDGTTLDLTAASIRNFDAVTDVKGTFVGAKRVGQFSLTKYEIQYHDFTNGLAAMTSQRRFSFLPSIFSIKSVFSMVVEDSSLARATGESRIGGLYIPGDFVFTRAAQVIVPKFNGSGKLESVGRPAMFQLEAEKGCSALASAKIADSNGPSEFVFQCGDHFLSVPMAY